MAGRIMIDPHETSAVPLISEHDTWISVDPITGCLANCMYCYLGPRGLRGRRPMFRVSPADLAAEVSRYLDERSVGESRERLTDTPMCFGNYTDTFMSADTIDYFREYAKLHAESFASHPLCIVTKARLKPDDLDFLDQLQHLMIIFVSQSFLRQPGNQNPERGPTSLAADTINNIRRTTSSRCTSSDPPLGGAYRTRPAPPRCSARFATLAAWPPSASA
jgi:hypothetical protein